MSYLLVDGHLNLATILVVKAKFRCPGQGKVKMSALSQQRTLEVSIIDDVNAERGTYFFGLITISRQKNSFSDVRHLRSASTAGRRDLASLFAIFLKSGRAEARYGDLLKQVRAGHDG